MDILIKNGIIVTAERSYEADLFISNGKIKEIEKSLTIYHDEVKVIDANGLFLLPGGIDPHVHMHLPLFRMWIEDISIDGRLQPLF